MFKWVFGGPGGPSGPLAWVAELADASVSKCLLALNPEMTQNAPNRPAARVYADSEVSGIDRENPPKPSRFGTPVARPDDSTGTERSLTEAESNNILMMSPARLDGLVGEGRKTRAFQRGRTLR